MAITDTSFGLSLQAEVHFCLDWRQWTIIRNWYRLAYVFVLTDNQIVVGLSVAVLEVLVLFGVDNSIDNEVFVSRRVRESNFKNVIIALCRALVGWLDLVACSAFENKLYGGFLDEDEVGMERNKVDEPTVGDCCD